MERSSCRCDPELLAREHKLMVFFPRGHAFTSCVTKKSFRQSDARSRGAAAARPSLETRDKCIYLGVTDTGRANFSLNILSMSNYYYFF